MSPLRSATALDALERPLQTEKGIDQADVVITAYELAVVEQVVTSAAPERFVNPGGVQAPGPAVAVGADKPPPFTTEMLVGGDELHCEIELHARWGQADSRPQLITDEVARSDKMWSCGDADALRGAESSSGRGASRLTCGRLRAQSSSAQNRICREGRERQDREGDGTQAARSA